MLPKLNGTDSILGGFIFLACSSTKEILVVTKPATSNTLAITLTALVQAGQVGINRTTSTPSAIRFWATSGPYSSVNAAGFLKAPMKE